MTEGAHSNLNRCLAQMSRDTSLSGRRVVDREDRKRAGKE